MFVKPATPDLKIPVPDAEPRRFLKPDGEEVPDIEYWRRLLLAGDVLAGAEPAPRNRKEA